MTPPADAPRRSRIQRLLSTTLVFAMLAAGCLGNTSSVTEPLPAGPNNILFIGNSLVARNDLPATVAAIAESAGDTIAVRSVTGPGLAIIDHLNGATNAEAVIRQGGWKYVVLQQGPTPSGICRDSLVLWTKQYEPIIRGAGATPALLMTWPSSSQEALFDAVRVSFEEAARAVDGVFMPAGEAWRSAWRADPALTLHGGDGFHPSPIGTFLAALEVYERISGHDVRTLPPTAFSRGEPLALPEATVRLLQEAAHAANLAFPARPAPPAAIGPAGASPTPPRTLGRC